MEAVIYIKKNSFQSFDLKAIFYIFLSDIFQSLSEKRDFNPSSL